MPGIVLSIGMRSRIQSLQKSYELDNNIVILPLGKLRHGGVRVLPKVTQPVRGGLCYKRRQGGLSPDAFDFRAPTCNLVFLPGRILLPSLAFLPGYSSPKPRVTHTRCRGQGTQAQPRALRAVGVADGCSCWFYSSQGCCEGAA